MKKKSKKCIVTVEKTPKAILFKNGKEIPFSELNEGDTVRVSYTYHGSDDGTVGFYETLDTVVVLDDEYTDPTVPSVPLPI